MSTTLDREQIQGMSIDALRAYNKLPHLNKDSAFSELLRLGLWDGDGNDLASPQTREAVRFMLEWHETPGPVIRVGMPAHWR